MGDTSREGGGLDLNVRWLRNDLRAVNQVVDVVAKDGELLEGGLESGLKLSLVVHERLPLAGSPGVTSKLKACQ